MSACVEINGGGQVVQSVGETFPDCTQLALVGPGQLERLTYWADLAIALDPAEPELWELMGATLLVFIAVWGIKQVARLILNR